MWKEAASLALTQVCAMIKTSLFYCDLLHDSVVSNEFSHANTLSLLASGFRYWL